MKKLLTFALAVAMLVAAFASFAAEEAAIEPDVAAVEELAEAQPVAEDAAEEPEAMEEPEEVRVYPVEMINTHGYFYGSMNTVSAEALEEAGMLDLLEDKGEIYASIVFAYDFFEFGAVTLDGRATTIKMSITARDGEKIRAAATYTVLENGRVIKLPNRFYFTNDEENEGWLYVTIPDEYLYASRGTSYITLSIIDDGSQARKGEYCPAGYESLITNGGAELRY